MEKNLFWKAVFIIVLVLVAAWELYPPQKTLKPGLDLAGGTSTIYEIDTQGLTAYEKRDLAQRTIDVLRKRIDPANVQNLVWRPQGNTRIEIQTPLASAETRQKRRAFDAAEQVLESENINVAVIIRALVKDSNERNRDFELYARGSEERLKILEDLAVAYDERKDLANQRDELKEALERKEDAVSVAGLKTELLTLYTSRWAKLNEQERQKAVKDFVGDDLGPKDEAKIKLVCDYVETWAELAKVLDNLTDPETGKNNEYKRAVARLEDINLSPDSLIAVLEMPPKSSKRAELIEEFKRKFPSRAEKIDDLVAKFDDYRPFKGRLDDPEDLRRMIKGAGVLEFRILPKLDDEKTNPDEMAVYVESLKTKGPKRASDNKYLWCEIENIKEWDVTDAIVAEFAEKYYVLASNNPKEIMLHASGQRGWKMKKAFPDYDPRTGRNAIGFILDERGGALFWNITKNNIGRPLCILLDQLAISAPNINDAIRTRGIIQGAFSNLEIEDMVNKLNAGSLPARLIEPPISIRTIGPSIGAANRDRGIQAGLIGLAGVAVFMLIYYVGSGSIADAALFMNLLFVLAIMALSRATFTLPGIAGIILTIGMSVDANVLIFERIREEQQRGSSLRIAVRNGYQRAFRTIFDANITTFVTALILYMVASEEIKGFAITLMLGIISSMFTALFVTRVIFQILLQRKIIKDHLVMLRLLRNPKFNWMGARRVFLVLSVVLVAAGLFVFYSRDDVKNNKYDIEFTGGTSVQINLKSELARDQVEAKIHRAAEQMNNPRVAAARVYRIGTSNLQYEINTTETNKTTATVTFTSVGGPWAQGQTAQSTAEAIRRAQGKVAGGKLDNLEVTRSAQNAAQFVVATSQVNRSLIKEILETAFEGSEVVISEPVVQEIVNDAIRAAFAGQLQRQENLKPEIVSAEKITDAVAEAEPELAFFLGGVKILCNLQTQATGKQIQTRLNDLKFKPDMQNLSWFRHKILDSDLSELAPDKHVDGFVYISVEPEAGFRELDEDEWQRFVDNEKAKITRAMSLEASLPRVTQIDPSIGKQAKVRALIAIALSLVFIIGYIWIRFGTARYGIAAIVALVHDVCITLGAVVACTYIAGTPIGEKLLIGDFKINLEMIAAFLTIIGYSLNDTIVVFDRIRENRGKLAILNPNIITTSINQTLSRTILTSFTTFLVVLVMYIWGGAGLRGFTFAMLLGIITGTYSSMAIAAPILLIRGKNKAKTPKK